MDISSNAIPSHSTISFTSWLLSRGFVRWDVYTNISGGAVADLTGNSKYPSQPDETYYLTKMDSTVVYQPDSSKPENHDFYGSRMWGVFVPPATGDYIFYLRSDDASQLWLSPNADPAGLTLLCEETSCCNAFSNIFSAAQALLAGQPYAFQVLQKEGYGGDYVQVAVKLSTDPTAPNALPPVPAEYLGIFGNPDTAGQVTIVQQPQSQTNVETSTFSFSIEATNTYGTRVFYQWQLNGVDIPGANNAVYTTSRLFRTNNLAVYRCRLALPGANLTSAPAIVTIIPDDTPPLADSAASVSPESGAFRPCKSAF